MVSPDSVLEPANISAESLDDLARQSASLESAEPHEIIRFAVERYGNKLTMATAFGPEGCAIIHWLASIAPQTYIFNLDTGYQFQETLQLRDTIANRYGVNVVLEQPETTVAEYERIHGGPLYRTDSNRCCGDRKIAVIGRVLTRFDAWNTKFGVVKISPLANWTKAKVWDLIIRENIPYNPLHDQGYVSIGCFPCTRAITTDDDERAGRWSGTAKTECGLHVRED